MKNLNIKSLAGTESEAECHYAIAVWFITYNSACFISKRENVHGGEIRRQKWKKLQRRATNMIKFGLSVGKTL